MMQILGSYLLVGSFSIEYLIMKKQLVNTLYEALVFVIFYFAGVGFLQVFTLSTWYFWIRDALLTKTPAKLTEGFTLDTFHDAQLPGLFTASLFAIVLFAARRYFLSQKKDHD